MISLSGVSALDASDMDDVGIVDDVSSDLQLTGIDASDSSADVSIDNSQDIKSSDNSNVLIDSSNQNIENDVELNETDLKSADKKSLSSSEKEILRYSDGQYIEIRDHASGIGGEGVTTIIQSANLNEDIYIDVLWHEQSTYVWTVCLDGVNQTDLQVSPVGDEFTWRNNVFSVRFTGNGTHTVQLVYEDDYGNQYYSNTLKYSIGVSDLSGVEGHIYIRDHDTGNNGTITKSDLSACVFDIWFDGQVSYEYLTIRINGEDSGTFYTEFTSFEQIMYQNNNWEHTHSFTPPENGTYRIQLYYSGENMYVSNVLTYVVGSGSGGDEPVTQNYTYNISASKSTANYDDNITITFIPSDYSIRSGTVQFYVNGYNFLNYPYYTNGTLSTWVKYIPAGINNFSAYYTGDGGTHPAGWTNNAIVYVNPVETFISAAPVVMDVGESRYLTVTLIDIDGDAVPSQEIIAKINGVDYAGTTNANGIATILIPSTLTANTYTVSLSYAGGDWKKYQTPDTLRWLYDYGDDEDYLHKESSNVTTITVRSSEASTQTSLSLSPSASIDLGQSVTIVPTVTSGNDVLTAGGVEIFIDGSSYRNITAGGNVSFTPDSAKTYNIQAVYKGLSSYYAGSSSPIQQLTVNGGQEASTAILIITPYDIDEGASEVVSISLIDNAGTKINGYVVVEIANTQYFVNVTNGAAEIYVDGLKEGSYSVSAFFLGNDDYAAVNADPKSFEVNAVEEPVEEPAVTSLSVSPKNIDEGDVEVIGVSLTASGVGIGGIVVVTVDGVNYYANVSNGRASVTVKNLPAGPYSVSARFVGSDGYAASVASGSFVVSAVEEPVVEPVYVLPNATIALEKLDGAVLATLTDLDGSPISNADILVSVNGEASNATTDASGKYTVDVSANATVVVSFTDVNGIDVSSSIVIVENNNTVEVEKIVEVNNTVEVPVEVEKIVEVNNTVEVPVYVLPNATIALASEDGSSVIATLTDLDGNAISNADITVSVNGHESSAKTDANGAYSIEISGNSTVVVSYVDSNNITTTGYLNLIIINTVTEKIVEVNNTIEINNTVEVPLKRTVTSLDYNDMTTKALTYPALKTGEFFVYTLKDDKGNVLAGKNVSVGFNGHVYTYITDENGQAKTQVNLKVAGGYTFAVCFLGDEEYNASFVAAKITVEKQKPSLTVPAKTYKASAKTKTLTATFKDEKGQLIKGKSITFTVNGKTYTATTNAKGVASVKVSLSTKKTYSFAAKFDGDDTFAAVTKTGKLTIK
ncbi:Ig-like domain repeat protein [uncultured Methanobrevibacter sp.]|uniref:Ig-like domain repeat protein n=1 Tax=uncultured Methanobrevibacter sp. TaxID=253161 RepID=UPI002634EACF